jgi:hypothetical protein
LILRAARKFDSARSAALVLILRFILFWLFEYAHRARSAV